MEQFKAYVSECVDWWAHEANAFWWFALIANFALWPPMGGLIVFFLLPLFFGDGQ